MTEDRRKMVQDKINSLVKQGYSLTEIASFFHTTRQTVSNWQATGKVQKLTLIREILDFKAPAETKASPQSDLELGMSIGQILAKLDDLVRHQEKVSATLEKILAVELHEHGPGDEVRLAADQIVRAAARKEAMKRLGNTKKKESRTGGK